VEVDDMESKSSVEVNYSQPTQCASHIGACGSEFLKVKSNKARSRSTVRNETNP